MGETLKQNAAEQGAEKEELLFSLLCERAGRFYSTVQELKSTPCSFGRCIRHRWISDRMRYEISHDRDNHIYATDTHCRWYGMNFVHMPELSLRYGYVVICGICLLIVLIEIWFFKKKKWF